MVSRNALSVIYDFDGFTLDAERGELCRGQDEIPIQPKVLAVLHYLIRHRNRVVPRGELLDAVWPDVIVSEAALTSAVRDARVALDDDGRREAIRTLPRRGLRFTLETTEQAQAPRPTNPPIRRHVDEAFFGRTEVLDVLETHYELAAGGQGQVSLLTGDPGIGKTRCAEAFARRVLERGSPVHTGWCEEGFDGGAYWPWIQILRSVVRVRGAERVINELGALATDLATLLPEISACMDTPRLSPSEDTPETQQQLFESTATCLEQAARDAPQVVIIDDLHWADRSSLRLLRFLVRAVRDRPIQLIATFRHREPARRSDLTQTLAALTREGRTHRVPLSGLAENDVAAWLAHLAKNQREDIGAAHSLIGTLTERTLGNPLFIEQFARALETSHGWQALVSGAFPKIPDSLHDLVRQRLNELTPECRLTVTTAAILGRFPDLDLLSATTQLPHLSIADALEEARDAYLLHEPRGQGNNFEFVNPLIREIVVTEQPSALLASLRLRIATELAARGPLVDPADVSRHIPEATPGGVSDAWKFLARSGHRSMRLRAYDEAASFYRRALTLLSDTEDSQDQHACELLIARGRAESAAGRFESEGREALLEAVERARQAAHPDLLGEAVLELGRFAGRIAVGDPELIRLLEEGLTGTRSRDTSLHAQLLARLSAELYQPATRADGLEMGVQAVAMSRRLKDEASLGQAMTTRLLYLAGRGSLEERRTLAQELLALGDRCGDPDLALWGRFWSTSTAFESGQPEPGGTALQDYEALALRMRRPIHGGIASLVKVMRAGIGGRMNEAHLDANRVKGEEALRSSLLPAHASILLLWLQNLQGREIPEEELAAFESQPLPPDYATVPRCLSALFRAEAGRHDAATESLHSLANHDFAAVSDNMFEGALLAHLARTCALVGEPRYAASLLEKLAPFRDRYIVASHCHHAGATRRYLALLLSLLERFDEADREFARALELEDRMGGRVPTITLRVEWAQMLQRRATPGDLERASALTEDSLEIANTLELPALAERARRLAVA